MIFFLEENKTKRKVIHDMASTKYLELTIKK